MVILGVDPGIAIVGWGVIDFAGGRFRVLDYGVIETSASMPTHERLAAIYDELGAIIQKYRPAAMAVEELFWNTNQTTGIRVSQARGVILLAGAKKSLDIAEYTPLQVKQAVVGYGRADKKQVISMVTLLLSLKEPPRPDDAADALAVAICHAHSGCSRIAGYYNK